MKRWLAFGLGVLLASSVPSAFGQNGHYASLGRPVASSAPAASLGRPAANLVAPAPEPITPVVYQSEPVTPAAAIFRSQIADPDGPTPFRPPDDDLPPPSNSRGADSGPAERFLSGEPERRPSYNPSVNRSTRTSRYGEETWPPLGSGEYVGHRGAAWFESDHCFDYFASPVTNPFLFEDPRALTELRPVFMYQKIPSTNPVFLGGNTEYFGLQGRVAFTDRISFVFNELGFISFNPGSTAQATSGTGLAELRFGPKFTFLRSPAYKALGAIGLTFDVPAGTASAYQNVGKLSLAPYMTFGKNFFETQAGSINVIDTFGYSFSTDAQRSEMFYNSLHLDYDVRNRHVFYPLLELNWFNYVRSGNVNPFGTEGADLVNFGSMGVSGKNNLNLAVGFRFKFTERVQVGSAVEFPLLNRRDLNNFRFTIDMIWRY